MRMVDLVEHQVIPAVRTDEQLAQAAVSKADIVFLLYGNVFSLEQQMMTLHDQGKDAFVHLDFMEGIASDRSGIEYIAKRLRPKGIISTRSYSIVIAKEFQLMTIQRLFMIDSTAIQKGLKAVHASGADAVELMPGLMPKVIREVTERTDLPIIAGGLIRTQDEVEEALTAGALAVSVGNEQLWNMDIRRLP